jgi:azurin
MKANISTFIAALLLAAVVAGCGSDQDSADSSEAGDRTEPVFDVEQTADDAAASVEESAELAGDAMDDAGDAMADAGEQAMEAGQDAADRAGEMAADAAEQTREMAEQAGDEVTQMAEDAGEEMAQMAEEAGDQAEEAMAGAAGTMSMDDDAASSGDSGDPCVVDVQVGDSLAYSVDSISVPSSCESVTINLAHTGSLPKEAMGHNWVLVPADAMDAIGQAGMSAGLDNNYLPDDDRIVAATEIVGGGQRTSVTFSLDDLEDGVDYGYVCTFPGHSTVMRGSFNVE